MPRTVITATDVARIESGGMLDLPADAILTPLAREEAEKRKIRLRFLDPARVEPPVGGRVVALGADHAGFELKEFLKRCLQDWGYRVADQGTFNTEPVDYPDIARAVAQPVAKGEAWRGIIVDGAGIGSSMAANKVPGVRAALCYDKATARNSREHNDANVLTLGSRLVSAELAREMVALWLDTPFGGGRHQKRIDKIRAIEEEYLKGA